jgi:hypothetical protein
VITSCTVSVDKVLLAVSSDTTSDILQQRCNRLWRLFGDMSAAKLSTAKLSVKLMAALQLSSLRSAVPCNAVPQQLPPVVICGQHTRTAHNHQQRLCTRYRHVKPLRVAPKPYVTNTPNKAPATIAALARLRLQQLLLLYCCYVWQWWWQAFWLAEGG